MDFLKFTSVVGLLSDIALGFAAIFTACMANKGLKAWKDELAGKAQFATAQSLFLNSLKLRNQIRRCRSPFISFSEFPEGYALPESNEAYTPKLSTQKFEAFRFAYQNRWDNLVPELQEFEDSAVQAEAILDGSIKEATDALVRCANKLQISIGFYLDDIRNRGRDFEHEKEFGSKIKLDVMSGSDSKDKLSQDIDKALLDLKSLCGKYLNK